MVFPILVVYLCSTTAIMRWKTEKHLLFSVSWKAQLVSFRTLTLTTLIRRLDTPLETGRFLDINTYMTSYNLRDNGRTLVANFLNSSHSTRRSTRRHGGTNPASRHITWQTRCLRVVGSTRFFCGQHLSGGRDHQRLLGITPTFFIAIDACCMGHQNKCFRS